MTLPGPAAKRNSVIQRRLLPSPPIHTHTYTQRLPTFLPNPRDRERQEGRGDDEAIDREVALHSQDISDNMINLHSLFFLFAQFQQIGGGVKGQFQIITIWKLLWSS